MESNSTSCLWTGASILNFQQLKIIREAARSHFNLTEVANVLYTSQSGVSRHIKELEDELGVEIFERRGKRLTGLKLIPDRRSVSGFLR